MSNIIARQIDTYLTEWPEAPEIPCRETTEDEGVPWVCTRSLGHKGPHAAHYDSYPDDTDETVSVVGVAWVEAAS